MKKQAFETPLIESDTIEVLSNKLLQLTNELTITNQQLETARREKDEMFANISHDLRAPLSAIRSAVDLLLSGQDLSREERESSIKLIDRRTNTLEHMINDMYLLFSLESNEMPLHCEKLAVAPFFEEYFYNAVIDCRYNDKDMRLDLDGLEETYITIDIEKMVRVLDNLLTNAAKYSGSGATITLSVTTDATHKKLMIKVSDNGIGISAENLPHIFDRTYTVSNSRTPGSSTGRGLGLSIVKAIVSMHGGTIFCESKLGSGSTFTVILPLCEA